MRSKGAWYFVNRLSQYDCYHRQYLLIVIDNSADATHNEYDYDPIKQAKSDLKKKTQPIPDIAER
jgi:hypothetical protein